MLRTPPTPKCGPFPRRFLEIRRSNSLEMIELGYSPGSGKIGDGVGMAGDGTVCVGGSLCTTEVLDGDEHTVADSVIANRAMVNN